MSSGKSFNWLPCKDLANNRKQYELRVKGEIKECVLVGSLPDIGHHATETIEQKIYDDKIKLS